MQFLIASEAEVLGGEDLHTPRIPQELASPPTSSRRSREEIQVVSLSEPKPNQVNLFRNLWRRGPSFSGMG